MKQQSFLFLAQGFEEIEALTAVDVLRRADIPVKTVSITESLQVTGAHGITVKADVLYDNTLFDSPAWLILPGGLQEPIICITLLLYRDCLKIR